MKKLKCNKGFTMIEVLVVITMLGVLSAIVVPKVTNQLYKPKKSRAVIEIKSMKNAVDLYYAENNDYPKDKDSVVAVMQENGVLGGKFGSETALDPWGNPYYIKSDANEYIIWSEGPDKTDDAKDDIYTDQNKIDITVKDDNLLTSAATVNSDGTEVSEGTTE